MTLEAGSSLVLVQQVCHYTLVLIVLDTADPGTACIFGASIIFVDIFIRMIPSKRNFNIQDSNAFLSCSLSLSAGVMVGLEQLSIELSQG